MSTLMNFNLEPSTHKSIDTVFKRRAFDFNDWEKDFVKAMAESFDHHYKNNVIFKGTADLAHYTNDHIKSLSDVESIPWVFVQTFKEHALKSVSDDQVLLTFTSSGTGGTKTQLFLDAESLNRLCSSARNIYEGVGALDNQTPCNYLMFTYDISKAPDLGTAWTDVLISEMVPAAEKVFLLREKNGAFHFDLELAIETYLRFCESDKPLRILGFPAFMYHTFSEIQKRGLHHIKQPKNSWILTGGGWKNHKGEVLTKKDFAAFMNETTGIPAENVRDLFGMTEHAVGYVDCELGRLHIPTYSHAITRDPITLKKLKDGEVGLLQLFTPMLTSYPSLSLLTTDLARINPEACACGRPGKGLEYVMRAGLKPHEGCALRALEYLS